MKMTSPQVLERIHREIILAGRDTRYRIEAYHFLLNGLEFYITKVGERRHVSGQELSKGLAEFAVKQFGPLTWTVLETWGVTCTADFGYLVYNLIDVGLMSRQPGDTLEDFVDVFDLKEWVIAQDSFQIDPEFIKSITGA